MDSIPEEFNRIHHFVGTARHQIYYVGKFYDRGSSLYATMPAGPYRDKSALEIQFNHDKQKTIARFRFVQKDGEKFLTGKFSAWQTKDFGAPHNIEIKDPGGDQLTFFFNSTFDQHNWTTNILTRGMALWDLFHSFSIIGMDRNDVHNLLGPGDPASAPLNDVEFYQLTTHTDTLPNSIAYLELKYDKDRVVSRRIEAFTER
jgi:hypothetical protein